MTRYALALGSNLGDRADHLRAALDALANKTELVGVSPLYETEPVGGPEQEPFLNAVAVVETQLGGHHLLSLAHEIEGVRGRQREVEWGPRTLDIDIVATDGEAIDDPPALVVPHPMAKERRFVLEPLVEVWPDAPVGAGVTATEALRRTPPGGVDLLAAEWSRDRGWAGRLWVAGQLVVFSAIGLAYVLEGSMPVGRVGIGRIIGALFGLVGLVGMAWSARSLGAGLTAVPEPAPGGAMIVSGPYRWVRHPMYTSVFLLFAGAALFLGSMSALALSVLLLAYFWLKSRYEERQLRIAYSGYRSYRRRVRSRFVPYFL